MNAKTLPIFANSQSNNYGKHESTNERNEIEFITILKLLKMLLLHRIDYCLFAAERESVHVCTHATVDNGRFSSIQIKVKCRVAVVACSAA